MNPVMSYGWQMMYVGAFSVLAIGNGSLLLALADYTRSDEEATTVLRMLRDGPGAAPIDRGFLALKWLQDRRRADKERPS